jgi:hypothetical protein
MAIELNDNIKPKAPKILDDRYSMNGVTPYVDVAEANATIPLTYRSLGLPVLIGNVEYWYRDGITDIDLVPKVGGADANFVHTQSVAATTWNVPHNLGKRCSVSITDSLSKEIDAQVDWVDNNNVTITLNEAVTGFVYCN